MKVSHLFDDIVELRPKILTLCSLGYDRERIFIAAGHGRAGSRQPLRHIEASYNNQPTADDAGGAGLFVDASGAANR